MTWPRTAIVAGLLEDGLGIGEAARGYARALHAAGLEVSQHVITLPGRPPRLGDPGPEGRLDLPHAGPRDEADVVVVCLHPPELNLLRSHGVALPAGRRLVGVWAYEVDRLPQTWADCRHRFDELWASGEFIAGVLDAQLEVPVYHVSPMVTVAPAGEPPAGLPPRYLLTLADSRSELQRKNPLGAVDAYLAAFGPDDGQHLVVKIWGGEYRPDEVAVIAERIADRPDISLIDRFLPRSELLGLLRHASGVVALHRAEGYGLHLIEAALLGVPIVTTWCGGPTRLFDEGSVWGVPATPCPVPADIHHYPPGATWHEPDLDAAAAALRALVAGGAPVQDRVERARVDASRRAGPDVAVAAVRRRLDAWAATPTGDDPRSPLPPRLMVVAAAGSAWPHAEPLISSVRPQLASTDVEVVVGLHRPNGLPDAERPPGVRRVLLGDRSPFALRAAALTLADSDAVLVTEEHVRLGPRTVEAYLTAMPVEGLAAGPVDNASRASRADWANYLLGFSMWASPLTSVPATRCPTIANVVVARHHTLIDGAPGPVGHLERHVIPGLWAAGHLRLVPEAAVEHVQSRSLLGHAASVFHDARTAGAALRNAGDPDRPRLTPSAVKRSTEHWLRDLVVLLQDRPELWPLHRRCRWQLRVLAVAKALGVAVGGRFGAGRSPQHVD